MTNNSLQYKYYLYQQHLMPNLSLSSTAKKQIIQCQMHLMMAHSVLGNPHLLKTYSLN